ncbi:hypothetical protein E3P89_03197 [Wallemia ichthyophaga]|uniref:THO complex subunit 5-like protein n=2 Tax=Wallemia ichthyophaga TaxID=245174 RepID=A0A4T0I1K6_WALIC|nr:THO complex subunit 5-like protein [Wallemia ichthyophaga EXF-994]TIA70104.1 hypothetical protein E3P91_03287 [Wallemia ichthyophaga]EOR04655.1 THO complex subunit 5-like protein [Wallemia ichthyophaga EXF-994]TIA79531.1 hypothetical protein E3P98_03233 [Wallemia ichthyophaga]TIA93021.1 hypothetical protein E3P97_01180 [Wallemia ichthyophaga]TIB02383.1 hypothetical protein E3P95_01003 [Wallemia ichthyophaga]
MEQLQQSLETTGSISLPQKVALLSHLKALNRDSSSVIRQSKQAAAHQAQLSDGVHAQVQNLLYERRHLEQEIERCRNFETSFDKVPLVSLDEYRKLNGGKEEDEHVLMLNRLKFELRTRQELNDHRNQLQEVRSSINSENNQTKNSLEDLDSDLDKFVDFAKGIQSKLNKLDKVWDKESEEESEERKESKNELKDDNDIEIDQANEADNHRPQDTNSGEDQRMDTN